MKLLLGICLLATAGALTEKARFDNYRVHRVIARTPEQLKALQDLQENSEYNFWLEPTWINHPVDIMVAPHNRPEFQEFITNNGLQAEVSVENVQELINDEEANLGTRDTRAMDWNTYHNYAEFLAWLDSLTKTYKNVKKIVLGKTYEDREIVGIEIIFDKKFPTVFLESGIHAREWIAPAASSYVVNELLKSPADSVWRKFNYIYVPFYNPDGYVFTWTTNRMWRKTRTPYKSGSRTCYGADPNRNWDFHWGEIGCSKDPCSEIYPGPKAFSEVETRTVSEYLKSNAKAKKIDVYLAFHSYSQLIMYPWGYTPNPAPLKNVWQRIGDAAAKDLAAVDKTVFRVGDSYHIIYPTSGCSEEWFYANFNSTITYCIELRDTGKYGFLLPPQFILPSGKELFAGVQRMLIEYGKLPPKYK